LNKRTARRRHREKPGASGRALTSSGARDLFIDAIVGCTGRPRSDAEAILAGLSDALRSALADVSDAEQRGADREREACAKVCDEEAGATVAPGRGAADCARRIRSRGTKKTRAGEKDGASRS
jgi:hypothetical protein